MKRLTILVLVLAGIAAAQCSKYAPNPFTGKMDCISPSPLKCDPATGTCSIGATLPANSPAGTLGLRQAMFAPRTPQTLVSFVVDDGFASTYTILKSVFEAHGVVACPAMASNSVGTAGKMSWVQLQELQTGGWEILSHGKTHANLTTLTEAQITDELAASKQAFADHGLTVSGFVYPYGDSNALARRLARNYYSFARGTRTGPNPLITSQYDLYVNGVDDPTQLAAHQAVVDAAESSGKWVIFSLHDVDGDDATAVGTLLDYIQGKNIPILTVSAALAQMGNMLDVGDNFAIGENGVRINFIDGIIYGNSSGQIGFGTRNLDSNRFVVEAASVTDVTFKATAADSTARLVLKNDAKSWGVKVTSADNFEIKDETAGVTRVSVKSDTGVVNIPAKLGVGTADTNLSDAITASDPTLAAVRIWSTGADSTARLLMKNDARTWGIRTSATDTFELRDETGDVTRWSAPLTGGLKLHTAAQPTCDSSLAGTFMYTEGGTGVKDSVTVCAKDASNAYAWRTIY